MIRVSAIFFFLIIFIPEFLFAQASWEMEAWQRRDFQSLEAFGLLSPWPHATGNLAAFEKDLQLLEKSYQEEPLPSNQSLGYAQSQRLLVGHIRVEELFKRWQPLFKKRKIGESFSFINLLHFELAYLSEPPSLIQAIDPGVQAQVAALSPFRQGESLEEGFNLFWETGHLVGIKKRYYFIIQPRLAWRPSQDGDEWQLGFRRLEFFYASQRLRLSAGRGRVDWGFQPEGSLVLSSNAKEMDRLLVEGLFWRGPSDSFVRGSLLVANLGEDYQKSWPWLLGYRFDYGAKVGDFMIAKAGLSHRVMLGGSGAPEISFGEGAQAFFTPYWEENEVHHALSLEMSLRFLRLKGLQFYGELEWERGQLNFLTGMQVPRLGQLQTVTLVLEYGQTHSDYARSALYREGLSRGDQLLGYPWGPRAYFGHVGLLWDMSPKSFFEAKVGLLYRNSLESNLSETENRGYGIFSWQKHWDPTWYTKFSFSVERVENKNFINFADGWDWAGFLSLGYVL